MTRIYSTVIALALVAFAVAGCGSSENERSRVAVDLAPISDLGAAATQDAAAMDLHAAAMATAGSSRPEFAQWLLEADTIRANAASLRLLASWAATIHHDPGSRSGESAELIRILGDGVNLQHLGETLIAHAGAMETHVTAMRLQTRSDPALASIVGQLGSDTVSMRRDGQAAIDRGKALQETARKLAQSLGETIE